MFISALMLTASLSVGQATMPVTTPTPPVILLPGRLRETLPFRYTPGLLNNGSLETTLNPSAQIGLPNQIPFLYVASRSEEWRLQNNGLPMVGSRAALGAQGAGFSRGPQPAPYNYANPYAGLPYNPYAYPNYNPYAAMAYNPYASPAYGQYPAYGPTMYTPPPIPSMGVDPMFRPMGAPAGLNPFSGFEAQQAPPIRSSTETKDDPAKSKDDPAKSKDDPAKSKDDVPRP